MSEQNNQNTFNIAEDDLLLGKSEIDDDMRTEYDFTRSHSNPYKNDVTGVDVFTQDYAAFNPPSAQTNDFIRESLQKSGIIEKEEDKQKKKRIILAFSLTALTIAFMFAIIIVTAMNNQINEEFNREQFEIEDTSADLSNNEILDNTFNNKQTIQQNINETKDKASYDITISLINEEPNWVSGELPYILECVSVEDENTTKRIIINAAKPEATINLETGLWKIHTIASPILSNGNIMTEIVDSIYVKQDTLTQQINVYSLSNDVTLEFIEKTLSEYKTNNYPDQLLESLKITAIQRYALYSNNNSNNNQSPEQNENITNPSPEPSKPNENTENTNENTNTTDPKPEPDDTPSNENQDNTSEQPNPPIEKQ